MNPTTISIHPSGRIIAHYPDRALSLGDLPADERTAVLAEMAARYNTHDDLAERAAAVPEEVLV